MRSIRYKATVITLAEILIAMFLVYLASYSIVQAENERRSVTMMDLLAQDTSKSFEEYTTGIAHSVDMIANLANDTLDSVTLSRCGVVSGSTPADRTPEQTEALDEYLSEFSKGIEVEFAAVAEHTFGVETYYFAVSNDISTPDRGFYYSRVGRSGFYRREPFDPLKLDYNDPAHSGWYFKPIERGRPSWIGPFPATSLNELLICSYVVPLYKSGALLGVLGMDIPNDTLVSLVKSIRVYETGFACLLDADGNVIYHPELPMGSTLDLPIGTDIFQQVDSEGTLIRYVSASGEERQMSFTTLSTGMKLVIVAPTSEINASTMRLTYVIMPIAIGVLIVIALLSMLVMGRLTGPLQRLTAASQRLSEGDYDVKLDWHSDDEVGALTTAFQRMRDQIGQDIMDLNRQVHTDDLTGLPNQRHFFDLALAERDRMLAEGKCPAILYFNLMGMKHYNRQYGFAEGDRLICDVADTLARHFGKDLTSRFGQDHFAAVCDVDGLTERLSLVLDECRMANGGKSLPVSVGVYQDDVGDVDVSVACDRAKFACDRRRGSFISGVSYFDREMQRQLRMTRYVISHLDEAIQSGWIHVCYQPIVRAVSGKVCDEEALSRWIDPERGFLSPSDFIPALEGASLIYHLDLYVLETVLKKMRHQQQTGLYVVPHSINLSRSDFEACDIVEEIRARVDESGIARNMISIEVTESIVGSGFEFMKGQIERFRDLGFPVWMDDFGSGYSSLDFLQSLKFDLIKFDQSFLRKLDEGKNGRIILTELMRMATALGVDTICEGVENEGQVQFLREIGCSKLQGYYYCKAIPCEEILARYQQGIQIGYENPAESEYFESIGRVNLHDLTSIAHEDEDTIQNAFNMVPMAIMEVSDDTVVFVRTNQSFRDFMGRFFWVYLSGAPEALVTAEQALQQGLRANAQECCKNRGSRIFVDKQLPDGSVARCLMRHIQTNPVTGTVAIVIAILSIASTDESRR